MACNPKTQAFIVDRDAIDPDEGIQELALFYPNGLPISFGTIASEIDAEVIDARGTYPTLGDRLDAGGGGSGVSDHGALNGLSDDDHKQYSLSGVGDFVGESTVLTGPPRLVVVAGDDAVITLPDTLLSSYYGRIWAFSNATDTIITIDAGSSGALLNATEQAIPVRPGRQVQITLIDIGFGPVWGVGSLYPVPAAGGAIGASDIIAGSNITIEPSEDNQQITISASGGGSGTSDHSELINLDIDDHLQYARRRACVYVNNDITLPLHTDAWLGGLNSFIVVGNNSSITMPNTLNSNTAGRSYYITNNSNGIVNIYAGTSGAHFLAYDPTIFKLAEFKQVKITHLNIVQPGQTQSTPYWVIDDLQPSEPSGGAIGVNDLQFSSGFTVSSPENGILPLTIGFAANAAAEINYTPANAAHWPTQPTTVGEALNLIAGRVSGLEP